MNQCSVPFCKECHKVIEIPLDIGIIRPAKAIVPELHPRNIDSPPVFVHKARAVAVGIGPIIEVARRSPPCRIRCALGFVEISQRGKFFSHRILVIHIGGNA